jgi:hypothetical protein
MGTRRLAMILVAMFLSGVLLYVIGSTMDRVSKPSASGGGRSGKGATRRAGPAVDSGRARSSSE